MKRAEIFEVEVFAHTTMYDNIEGLNFGFVHYTVYYTGGGKKIYRINQFRNNVPKTVFRFLARTDLYCIDRFTTNDDFMNDGIHTETNYRKYSVCPF